ncbi:hypothetical protein HX99_03570 [Peptococcaceae bacterium SCADC1_2_3]|jgi:hypothetical protein|nr:hypothetical protein DK28_0213395 [Peptococcaceae bacterium SCADC1_2_3]KFI36521.1 hypothetical protein HX99_03570 [Peptococcaceae bacterium SCADC1_2_3]KFI37966.1 hypothetical protein HY02_00480 [Peptococcaceae bacterium SCADC1_2_3]HBQ29257.1 hypothetical protein [Desulfotomaculum sp.]HCJ79534.1 hypothetical protein [Desulfotomaculum sp.]
MDKFLKLYLDLPRESFELMLTQLKMFEHESKSWQEYVSGRDPGSIKWAEHLSPIYQEMFKMFFRPLESMTGLKLSGGSPFMFPVMSNPLLGSPWETFFKFLPMPVTPLTQEPSFYTKIMESYLDLFKLWSESYQKLYQSLFSTLGKFGEMAKEKEKEGEKETPQALAEGAKEMLETWVKNYQEMLQTFNDTWLNMLKAGQTFYTTPFTQAREGWKEVPSLMPPEILETFSEGINNYFKLQKGFFDSYIKLYEGVEKALGELTQKILPVKGSSNPGHNPGPGQGPFDILFLAPYYKNFYEVWLKSYHDMVNTMNNYWLNLLKTGQTIYTEPLTKLQEGWENIPFMMPKEALDAFFKGLNSQVELQKAWFDYYTKLYETWENVQEEFTKIMTEARSGHNPGNNPGHNNPGNNPGNSPEAIPYHKFVELSIGTAANLYERLLGEDSFVEAQSKMIHELMDTIVNQRKFWEALLGAYPFLPFVYRSEIDDAYQRLHTLRRKVRDVEKREFELSREIKDLQQRKEFLQSASPQPEETYSA